MLTLAELTRARTKDEFLEQFLDGLRGLGIITQLGPGAGAGSLSASGNPTKTASVQVEILTTGELGVATFRYSTDGGATWSGATVIPVNGVFVLPNTGVTLQFTAALSGSSTSFVDGDIYALELTTPNFPVTSWQPGSVPLTMAEVVAEGWEDFSKTQLAIAEGGLLDYAEGDWLALLAKNVYGLDRKPAVRAQGTLVLADAANAGPFPIAVGQLWAVSASGKRFTNTNAGVLALGGTQAFTFEAEQPGADYNVGNNTITVLATPLPGVTVNNPDPGSGTWLTQQGINTESDADLRIRCKERWSALGIGGTADAYSSWAKAASTNVTRVKVQTDALVAGQVDVYLAGPAGGVDGATVAAVLAYIQARAPLCVLANVVAAANHNVTVQGPVTVEAAQLAAAQVAVAANLDAFFQTLEIGGVVRVAEIIEQVMIVAGVKDFAPTLPAANVVLAANEVATLTQNLTWVAI